MNAGENKQLLLQTVREHVNQDDHIIWITHTHNLNNAWDEADINFKAKSFMLSGRHHEDELKRSDFMRETCISVQ